MQRRDSKIIPAFNQVPLTTQSVSSPEDSVITMADGVPKAQFLLLTTDGARCISAPNPERAAERAASGRVNELLHAGRRHTRHPSTEGRRSPMAPPQGAQDGAGVEGNQTGGKRPRGRESLLN